MSASDRYSRTYSAMYSHLRQSNGYASVRNVFGAVEKLLLG